MKTLKEQIKCLDTVLKTLPRAITKIDVFESGVPFSRCKYYSEKVVVTFDSRFHEALKYGNEPTYFSISLDHINGILFIVICDNWIFAKISLKYNLKDKIYRISNSILERDDDIFIEEPSNSDIFNLRLQYECVDEAFEILDITLNNIDVFVREINEDF